MQVLLLCNDVLSYMTGRFRSVSNAELCHHQVRLQENYSKNIRNKMETNSENTTTKQLMNYVATLQIV